MGWAEGFMIVIQRNLAVWNSTAAMPNGDTVNNYSCYFLVCWNKIILMKNFKKMGSRENVPL